MIQEIFKKALESHIFKNETIKENFKSLQNCEWIPLFSSEITPSPEDFKEEPILSLLEKFLLTKKLFKSDSIGLWQSLIQKSAQSSYPFLSFSFLIIADRLFQKVKKEADFYVLEERLKGGKIPYRHFMENFMQLKADTIEYFIPLRNFLPLKETSISPILKKFSEDLCSALPQNLSQPEAMQNIVSEEETTISQNTENIESSGRVIEKEDVYELEKIKSHSIFGAFVPPLSLLEICKAAIGNKQEQILKLLSENIGFTSWRDRFAKNIVLLYWALQNNKEKEIVWIAKSLWDTVFSLGARNKAEIDMDKPQDIILALWEPHLYCILVHLTLQAFDKLGESKFKFNVGPNSIQNVVEKLRSHSFILGVFIQE